MNEKIRIGADVVLTVVRINANSVRLGIEAPRDIPVRRQEHVDADTVAVAAAQNATEVASEETTEVAGEPTARDVVPST